MNAVNEIAEIKGCNNTILLEVCCNLCSRNYKKNYLVILFMLKARKKQDLYMWVSCTPSGPSAKFLVQNGK